MGATTVALFIAAQLVGGTRGAVACHLMFDLPLLQFSIKARAVIGQWVGEFVATFRLVLTILLLLRFRAAEIPAGVALYITSAYWFTSSTSFANPAITIVRSFSNTFAGIAPNDVLLFVMAQILGALLAVGLVERLTKPFAIK